VGKIVSCISTSGYGGTVI